MSSIGILIGFYGYLFPGNINLMVVHLYTSKRYQLLWKMLVLIAFFESLYCAIVLYSLQTLQRVSIWYQKIEILSYTMILLMGIWMLSEKKLNHQTASKNTLYRGLLNIVIHPQQIPFWMVTGVLLNQLVGFSESSNTLIIFIFFNAIGTVLVMLSYMLVGSKLVQFFRLNLTQLNRIMGTLYLLLAMYHLTKWLLHNH